MSTLFLSRRWLVIAGAAALLCAAALPRAAVAQSDGTGPTAMIVSYRARPGERVRFRKLMATEGLAQFDNWKALGVFASYNALFTAYAADTGPDMYAIFRFAHFADLRRWQKIEENYPGGLTEQAQALATVDTSGTADIVQEKSSAATTPESQFFVLQYDVLADMPKYASYVQGYVAPQFEKWMKTGALVSYASFVNQNPAGAAWGSFIVLEYKDFAALSTREVIKTKARQELAVENPVWKKWSDDKSAIRKEKTAVPTVALR